MRKTNPRLPPLRTLVLVLLPAIVAQPDRAIQCPAAETDPGVRAPISITLILMDLTAAQSVIRKHDLNDDGKLSVSELAERLAERRNRMGLTPSDQLAARKILAQADRDRDGVISATELASFGSNPVLPKCDDDHDGKVTEFELERFFGNRRRELGFDDEDAKRATILVQRNDTDGSRTLDRSELVASGSDRSSPLSPDKLPLIDTNQDGKLSVDELARHLKKTR